MVSLRHGMSWQPKGEHICEYTHREALVPLLTNKQPPRLPLAARLSEEDLTQSITDDLGGQCCIWL